jgi:hypothetical protein
MVSIDPSGMAVSVWSRAPELQISVKIAQREEAVPEGFTQLTRSMSRHRKRSSKTVVDILLHLR